MPRMKPAYCTKCGIEFMAPEKYGGPKNSPGKTCPNGHFNNMSAIRKLLSEVAQRESAGNPQEKIDE